ncbi:MAG: protein O-mannosyl-transferase family, partial [Anaerolineae bacterium]
SYGPPLLVGSLSLTVYFLTLAPSVVSGIDAPALQYFPYRLLIPHTGYPLYILLGWVWTHLFAWGELAFRMNLLSAIYAAAAVAVLYKILLVVGRSHLASATGALIFALTPTFWSQAIITEVYTLHLLLLSLLLYQLLLWREGQAELWHLALVYGLGLTHHRLTLLYGPLLLVAVLMVKGRTWRDKKALAALLLPLLLYLYVPIRGTQLFGWSRVATLGTVRYIAGLGATESLHLRGDVTFLTRWVQEMSLIVLVVAAVGWAFLLYKDRWLALLLTSLLAVSLLFNISYQIPDIEPYFIPEYFFLSIFAGLGMAAASQAVQSVSPGRTLKAVGLIVLVGLYLHLAHQWSQTWPRVDMSGATELRDRSMATLLSMPPHAVLAAEHNTAVPAQYLHRGVGIRPDVEVILMNHPWQPDATQALLERAEAGHIVYVDRLVSRVDARFVVEEKPGWWKIGLATDSQPQVPLDLALNPNVRLVGYDLSGDRLVFYWKVEQPFDRPYSIFTHYFGPGGEFLGQGDKGEGEYPNELATFPTTQWQVGQIIRDYYHLPKGTTLVKFGFYRVDEARYGEAELTLR